VDFDLRQRLMERIDARAELLPLRPQREPAFLQRLQLVPHLAGLLDELPVLGDRFDDPFDFCIVQHRVSSFLRAVRRSGMGTSRYLADQFLAPMTAFKGCATPNYAEVGEFEPSRMAIWRDLARSLRVRHDGIRGGIAMFHLVSQRAVSRPGARRVPFRESKQRSLQEGGGFSPFTSTLGTGRANPFSVSGPTGSTS